MIFRRSNDISASKNTSARAPQNTTTSRREPEVTSRTTAPSTATPTLSPVAMAQARRSTPASPASTFNRPEQLRKLTVGRDISLNGEIATCDHLIVEGNVSATIKGGQVLEISENGTFNGLVDIEQADIAGVFDGDLTVRGKLILRPTAVVSGLIRYGRLQVDAGATLNGQLAALPPEVAAETPTNSITGQSQQQTPSPFYNNLSSVNDQPGFLKASA